MVNCVISKHFCNDSHLTVLSSKRSAFFLTKGPKFIPAHIPRALQSSVYAFAYNLIRKGFFVIRNLN